jgi:rRNA-processing protein FCF1
LLTTIGSIAQKFTTSHVIGELQGLTSRLKLTASERVGFWSASIELVRLWGLDESLIRLMDLSSEPFERTLGRIGPPDTGVIKLALDHNCILITEDARELYAAAHHAGVDCRLLEHLINQV